MLAKMDVESAFRIIPVHPADHHLLGMEWGGQLYIDTSLPFGLRSAPKIFNAAADALQWITARGYLYLALPRIVDDFLVAGKRGKSASIAKHSPQTMRNFRHSTG